MSAIERDCWLSIAAAMGGWLSRWELARHADFHSADLDAYTRVRQARAWVLAVWCDSLFVTFNALREPRL